MLLISGLDVVLLIRVGVSVDGVAGVWGGGAADPVDARHLLSAAEVRGDLYICYYMHCYVVNTIELIYII